MADTNKFLRQNILIFLLLNTGNLFSYLFQLVIARSLSPVDFGIFNSLNSLSVIVSAPVVIMPLVLSKYTVQLSLEGLSGIRTLFWRWGKYITAAALLVLILGLGMSPLIKDFLHLAEINPIFIIICQMSICLCLPLPMGILQGLQRFLAFGLTGLGYPLGRFIAGVILVMCLGLGVNGALFSNLIGGILGLGIGIWALKDICTGPRQPLPPGLTKEMLIYMAPVLLTYLGVLALGNLDLILVKHFCTEQEAGFYATAAILGRIGFYLPGVLITVLFPAAAKSHLQGRRDIKSLGISLGLTLLLGGGFALVCSLFPALIIRLLFGADYVQAAPLFRLVCIAMAGLSLCNVLFTFYLADNSYLHILFLAAGLILLTGLVFVFHSSALQIAWILLGSILFILTVTLARELYSQLFAKAQLPERHVP